MPYPKHTEEGKCEHASQEPDRSGLNRILKKGGEIQSLSSMEEQKSASQRTSQRYDCYKKFNARM